MCFPVNQISIQIPMYSCLIHDWIVLVILLGINITITKQQPFPKQTSTEQIDPFVFKDKSTINKSRYYSDAIVFPGTVLTALPASFKLNTNHRNLTSHNTKNPEKLPEGQCITVDGKPGICKTITTCSANNHFQLSLTHEIVECGLHNGIELICCPESLNSNVISPWPTPKIYAAPETSTEPSFSSSLPTNDHQKNIFDQQTNAPQVELSKTSQDYDLFSTDEVQDVCGVFPSNGSNPTGISRSQISKQDGSEMWPWIVSIGRKHVNGSINWRCIGALITKEFILTTAHCVQRNPNVILVGDTYLGFMEFEKSLERNKNIQELISIDFHEKFAPSLASYRNIGLLRLKHPIFVTTQRIPICFPFLAGVLDIIPFNEFKVSTIGFDISSKGSTTGLKFAFEEYTIMNNSYCSRIYTNQNVEETIKRLPNGITSDNMCGYIRNPTNLCQAPGAPAIIYDRASESYVLIGISSGDPTCNELKRQIVTFTRVNAFSSWVRDRVKKLPIPPPCYI